MGPSLPIRPLVTNPTVPPPGSLQLLQSLYMPTMYSHQGNYVNVYLLPYFYKNLFEKIFQGNFLYLAKNKMFAYLRYLGSKIVISLSVAKK